MQRYSLRMIIVCLCIFTSVIHTYGQYNTVSQILISGNNRTKEYIILRELTFAVGDTLNTENIDEHITLSRQNLLNASLFNLADISYHTDSTGQLAFDVYVEEQWYWIPVIRIRTADGDFNTWWQTKQWNTLTYGVELTDYNFLGRKHQLKISLNAGYNNSLDIKYLIPYVDKHMQLGWQIEAGYNFSHKTVTGITDYQLTTFNSTKRIIRRGGHVMTGLIWRPKYHFTWETDIAFYYDDYNISVFVIQPPLWNTSSICYMQAYTKLKCDYRDYASYPLKGWYTDLIIEKNGWGMPMETVNSLFAQINARYYTPIVKRFYFGCGINLYSTFGTLFPITMGKFINSNEAEIRGLFPYLIPADHVALLKTNFKVALLEPTFVRIRNWDTRIGHLSFACYLNVFFDAMYFSEHTPYITLKQKKQLDPYQHVLGMGLDVVTSYDRVFRFETSYSFQLGKLFYGISFKTAI